ncbi:MFS transporter [Nonomuraea sp. NN258]|uniref:MFS transporter n=1 Tax=Nonomuraea antri TaxID=2730852 RepID=UPI001568E0C7|nr:MFS transporter [Nonomuraea antri]NRQ39240.1 MFS transporter [Nonomuraea antri]
MGHPVTAAHAAPPGTPPPRRWAALALLSAAQFMLILDVTVVNVALPSIGADLGLGRESLTWVVAAYTLCFGGLMLLGGRLADLFGARRVLMGGLAVFTLASLVTGLAPDGGVLIAGRVAQGVGAALLSPSALAIVTTTFHGAERTKALGVWAALGGTGSATGVLFGGLLTAGPGWTWVFFVNVPVGVAVLAAIPLTVPRGHGGAQSGSGSGSGDGRRRVDVLGALLVTTATGALIFGLVAAGESGWGGTVTLLSLGGAIVLYAGFAVAERIVRAPLMDVRMLGRRPVAAGAFLMLVATALLIAFFFLGSMLLQGPGGLSALETGLMFLPVAIATGVGAHLGGRLVGKAGARPVAAIGLGLAAAGSWLLPLGGLSTWYVLAGFVVAAFGLGGVFVAATTTALGFVAHSEAGLASGVVNTFHEVGGSVGVAVVSTVAAAGIEAGTGAGFGTAFTVAAVAAAVSALLSLALIPPGRPHLTAGPHVH